MGMMGHCRDCAKPTRSHKLESKFYQDVVQTEKGPFIVMVEVTQVQCHVCYEKAKTLEEL